MGVCALPTYDHSGFFKYEAFYVLKLFILICFLSEGITSMIGGPFVEDWRGEGSVWDAFRRVCPPDTRARRLFASIRGQSHVAQQPQDVLRRDTSSAEPHGAEFTFPTNVDNEFDFCAKSWGRYYQGHFFSDWRTLPALYPIFSPAKAPGFSDIMIPSHYYYGATKRCVLTLFQLVSTSFASFSADYIS